MGLLDIKHVVILIQENRSFDEYFGTFPEATGFNDPTAANIFDQSGFSGASSGGLRPYRMSTFTASGMQRPGHDHDWTAMHTYWAGGNMNGWADPDGTNFHDMAYYVANDIPYHWALATNFALCDHYFAAALSGTAPNRLFLMSGCIQDPNNPNPPAIDGCGPSGAALNNPGTYPPTTQYTVNKNPILLSWQTYADMLTQGGVQWKVYDESGDTPSWPLEATNPSNGWGSLNVLDLFGSDHSSANYSPGYGQFEADATLDLRLQTFPLLPEEIQPSAAAAAHVLA